MPNGSHAPLSTPRPRNGEPQPAPPPAASEPATTKRDLASWWKQFSKRGNVKKEEDKEPEPEPRGIFGVPLITSIPYANVAISLFNETGESYIYGYVPIVVAKCGVFLKEKATDVEGIFRLAGSEKRIKELKIAFDTPPRFGKGLDWTGYTVHDAANILRRYFNQLPEPIIPLQHYDAFRQPLRGHQAEAVGAIEGQAPSVGGFDPDAAVRVYQHLIKELPSLNRQLLLYILDLLAVFAAKSDVNKMTTSNLSAIFQPGILSHPQHDMSPQDYRLSQDVLIFLIDNQDHFLIGMEGTAVDEGTVKHVESGPGTPQARTPTTPGRKQSGLGRSASTASSAGAESLRKFGGVRRNVSTSSRHSRHSAAMPSPTAQSFATPAGSGVHRSNTVPSKRSPAIPAVSRFSRDRGSDPPTPNAEDRSEGQTVVPQSAATPTKAEQAPPQPVQEQIDVVKPASEEKEAQQRAVGETLPVAPLPSSEVKEATPTNESTPTPPATTSSPSRIAALSPQVHNRSHSHHHTPTKEKSEFMEGPIDTGTPVEPSPAVRTFTQILSKVSPGDEKKDGRKPNKLQKRQKPTSANPSAHSSMNSLTGATPFDAPPSPLPPVPQHIHPGGSKEAVQAYNSDSVSSRHSGATLKPSMSPSASFRSHSTTTDYSEVEQTEEAPKEEKRSFWKSHRRDESRATPTASQTDLSSNVPGGDKSVSSSGSNPQFGLGRRSLQHDNPPQQGPDHAYTSGPETKEEREKTGKSPLSWFREKRQEHKERHRAKSPPGSTSDLHANQSIGAGMGRGDVPVRGKSMDVPRSKRRQDDRREGVRSDDEDVTPTAASPPAAVNTGTLPGRSIQRPAQKQQTVEKVVGSPGVNNGVNPPLIGPEPTEEHPGPIPGQAL